MVNWQEAGKTWPRPHPHAVRLLRGLVWHQHYRHSHSQCEGGMPGSFELRQDMGPDRPQAVEDWLRVEGFAFRFQQRRWRVWTRPDRIEEDEKPNEYPWGASINVPLWDMIDKNLLEPGSECRLQGSSSSASLKKEKRYVEYKESLAAKAAQGAKGGIRAPSPQRANGGHQPGSTTLADFLQVAKHAKAKPLSAAPEEVRPQQRRGVGPPREDAGRPGQLQRQRRSRPKGRGARL